MFTVYCAHTHTFTTTDGHKYTLKCHISFQTFCHFHPAYQKSKTSSGSRVTATGSNKCKSQEQEDSFSSLPLLPQQRMCFDQNLIVLHKKNALSIECVESGKKKKSKCLKKSFSETWVIYGLGENLPRMTFPRAPVIHSAAYQVQKRKSLSGRANFLMVGRDRCCQRRNPV